MQSGDVRPRSSMAAVGRLTGALYLLIIVAAGFAEGYVRTNLIVAGDPSATAANVLASPTLFRLGIVADLVAFLADAAVAVLLYVLLRSGGQTVALLAAAFRLIAHPAIASLNLLALAAGLRLLEGGPALGTFDGAQREALALFAFDLHGYGYVIAGAFFGVHCVLLGYLLYRSDRFPRWLGMLMGAAGFGYLLEVCAVVAAPGLEPVASTVVVATAVLGEVSLCLYLLVRGVATPDASA